MVVDVRATAIIIGAVMVLAFVSITAPQVSAEPETQWLRANGVISTDATFLSDNANDPAALNRVYTGEDWGNDYDYDDNYWDSTPGCVLWGDANSAIDGSYGTAEVRYTLTDLTGETSAYYYLDYKIWVRVVKGYPPEGATGITAPTAALSFRAGFGYTDSAPTGPNEAINETYQNISVGVGTFPRTATTIDWFGVNNSAEGRPFTTAEINALYVVVQIRFDPYGWSVLLSQSPTPINLGICYTALRAVPIEYTPEAETTGGFVLRPNADNFAQGWSNYSVDGYSGKYGALNDTTKHGDAEQSYANATWAKSAYLGLGFTDPPSWAADIEYRVVLWAIIRHTETGLGELHTLTMSVSSAGIDQKEYYPSTSYTNNTHESDYIPGSSDYWTLLELEDIMANFWLDWSGTTPSGELRMTQVAFLCIPVVPGDYVPDTGDYTDDSFRVWLTTGNGMYTLFAIMGVFGMVAGAPLAIIMFKEGRKDGVGALALAIVIIFMSLCFLLVGLSPYN